MKKLIMLIVFQIQHCIHYKHTSAHYRMLLYQ